MYHSFLKYEIYMSHKVATENMKRKKERNSFWVSDSINILKPQDQCEIQL